MKKLTIFTFLMLAFGLLNAQIVTWDFAGINGASSAAANDIATDMETGAAYNVAALGSGLTAKNYGAADGLEAGNQTATTLADAISGDDYITFTVKPKSGYKMSLSSIDLRPFSQNRARSFALLSSVDGFSSENEIGTISYHGNSGSDVLFNIPLSGHSDITTEVEFRVYIYGGTSQYESCGLAGSGNDLLVNGIVEPSATLYSLTVNSGSGDGNYPEGEVIPISADTAPTGQQFDNWTGSSAITNANSASTTMTMPAANTTITANYKTTPPNVDDLSTWEFTGTNGASSMASNSSASGITASSASIGNGLTPFTYSDGSGLTAKDQNQTTLDGAISDEEYISFTLTPDSTMDITAVKLRPVSQNQSRTFALLSSVGGFNNSNVIGSFTMQGNINNAIRTINVSGHSALSSAVEFRLYIYGQSNQYEKVGLGIGDGNDLIVEGSTGGGSPATFTLLTSASNGSVSKNPDKSSYTNGEQVSLTATANSGYKFSNWSGDASGDDNPLLITMSSNMSITANFDILSSDNLTVSTSSLSFGSASGNETINVSSNISWTANANKEWISVSPASGSNNGTVTVSVTANSGGSRSGAVTISGSGITRTVSISQRGDTHTPDWGAVGMGLDGAANYSTYTPYSDAMKLCKWRNVGSWGDNGYPTSSIPGSTAQARMGIDNGDKWQTGNYTLTWEGSGEVILTAPGNATLVSEDLTSNPKKRVYNCSVIESYGLQVDFISYPVTNVHLYIPGIDENYQSLWNPNYLAYLEPFNAGHIRFMDLNGTNSSSQKDWADRTPRNWSSYANAINNNSPGWAVKGRTSYEAMIELCNEMGMDMWVCVPHMATDDYIAKLSKLIRTGIDDATGQQTTDPLNSDLKVWIEYSNEVWNWQFGQTSWLNEVYTGPGSNLNDKYSYQSRRLFEIFEQDFGGTDRLVRVIGTQGGWSGGGRTYGRLQVLDRSDYDAVALTTYINPRTEAEGHTQQWIFDNWPVTSEQILDRLELISGSGQFTEVDPFGNIEAANQYWHYYYGVEYDVPIIAYEGNDHIDPKAKVDHDGNSTTKKIALNELIPEATNLIHNTVRTERFANIYKNWLDRHHQSGLVTNTPFVMLSGWGVAGQWGHVEYIGQTVNEAPKYKALLDFYNLPYPTLKSAKAKAGNTSFNQKNGAKYYPNPVHDGILNVIFNDEGINTVKIISLDGKTVYQNITADDQIEINTQNLNTGLYILYMNEEKAKITIISR